MQLTLKNKNFTAIKVLFFRRGANCSGISSQKISCGKETVNILLVICMIIIELSLYIKLPKTTAFVKSSDGQTKWMSFD